MKTCFVISPIGAPDSAQREHADDVFEYIIKPAAERAGYAALRADHEAAPGLITDQMYDRIPGDDLLIVLLTFHNPNVFYELAVAEAAARPTILLIERGHLIPFDIKDRRIIEYDLKPRSLKTDRYVDLLFRAIAHLETAGADHKVAFRPGLAPLGGTGETTWRMLPRSEEFAPKDRLALIRNAGSALWYQGLALFSFAKLPEYEEALREALDRGVDVRVLLMHPDNPALPHLLHEFSSNYMESVRGEIRQGAEFWQKLAGADRLAVKFQTRGAMLAAIQMNDTQLVWTPYSLMRGTSDSPSIVAAHNAPLYDLVRQEFRWAWRASVEEPPGTLKPLPHSARRHASGKVAAEG